MGAFRVFPFALLVGMSSSLAAQNRPVTWSRWQVPALSPTTPTRGAETEVGKDLPSSVHLVMGGLVGGAAGLLGGAYAGYALTGGGQACGDDTCGLFGGILGAASGELLLLPLGVHLANGSRGNYGYSLLASVGIAVLGTRLVSDADSNELLLAVPVAQIISSVLIERATSRPKTSSHR